MINPYEIGNKIYLRTPTKSDLSGNWYQWFSDPETTEFLIDRWWPNSEEAQEIFYNQIILSKSSLVLSVCDKKTDKHIGVCSLSSINWVHRNADIALVIGDKKYKNGLVAVEIMTMLIKIAFKRINLLNLKSVFVSNHPTTPSLVNLFKFKQVGVLKDYFFYNDKYVDVIITQLKREDWQKRNNIKK